jgi:hypothetical protein
VALIEGRWRESAMADLVELKAHELARLSMSTPRFPARTESG